MELRGQRSEEHKRRSDVDTDSKFKPRGGDPHSQLSWVSLVKPVGDRSASATRPHAPACRIEFHGKVRAHRPVPKLDSCC